MRPTSIFVGGLGYDVKKEDLEKEFSKFGSLNKVWIARNPPGFAFIEFEDDQDAEAAIKEMNGTFIKGYEIHVDLSHGSRRGHDGRRRGRAGFDSRFRGRVQGSYFRGRRLGYEELDIYNRDKDDNRKLRSRSPMGQRKIMAHFKPQNELNNASRLDEPSIQGPIPRWQRKHKDKSPELNSTITSLNVSTPFLNCSANKSTSKTDVREQELNSPDYPHNVATGGFGNQNSLWPDYIDFEDLEYTELFNRYWYDSSLVEAKKDEEQFYTKVSERKSFSHSSCQTEKDISTFQNCELIKIKNCVEKIKSEFVKICEIFDKNISNDNKLKKVQKTTSVETQIVKKYKSHPNNKNLISIL